MVVKNIEVVNRELSSFVATEEGGSINFDGTYKLELKNIGNVPTAKLSAEVKSLSLEVGGELLTNETAQVGRLRSGESTTLEFDFSEDIDASSEIRTVARTACADRGISIESTETVSGVVQSINIDVSGGIEASSGECDLGQTVTVPDSPGSGTTPQEPPNDNPSNPPEDPPNDGDSNGGADQGGGDGNSDDSDNQQPPEDVTPEEPPEDVSVTLEGPEIVSVGDTKTYDIANPSDAISLYSWQSSTADQQISEQTSYTVEFDEVANEAVSVTATDDQGNELASDRVNVVVVASDQSEARDDPDSEIDGLRFMEPNQSATYSWSYPDGTIQFQWQVLAEADNANVTLQRSGLTQDRLDLEFFPQDDGNYLIAIGAIGQQGNLIGQAQKEVSVVTTE